MKLFDFFFPQQAQASHLRRVADVHTFTLRHENYEERARARRHTEIDERFNSIEDQLGFLTLMLEAIIRKSEEKGVVTRDELQELMKSIDREDGKADGQYTPGRND